MLVVFNQKHNKYSNMDTLFTDLQREHHLPSQEVDDDRSPAINIISPFAPSVTRSSWYMTSLEETDGYINRKNSLMCDMFPLQDIEEDIVVSVDNGMGRRTLQKIDVVLARYYMKHYGRLPFFFNNCSKNNIYTRYLSSDTTMHISGGNYMVTYRKLSDAESAHLVMDFSQRPLLGPVYYKWQDFVDNKIIADGGIGSVLSIGATHLKISTDDKDIIDIKYNGRGVKMVGLNMTSECIEWINYDGNHKRLPGIPGEMKIESDGQVYVEAFMMIDYIN